jgi:CheY-like chemotaxis protein
MVPLVPTPPKQEDAAARLDLNMPVMGGEETLRQLKLLHPDVRVILSSGYNEMEATRLFTGKDLVGFIQKPYTAAQLAEKIRAALEAV